MQDNAERAALRKSLRGGGAFIYQVFHIPAIPAIPAIFAIENLFPRHFSLLFSFRLSLALSLSLSFFLMSFMALMDRHVCMCMRV